MSTENARRIDAVKPLRRRSTAKKATTPLTLTERLFALKRTPPFDRLRDSELASIAEAAQSRFYAEGDIVAGPTRPLQELLVVTAGRWIFVPENSEARFGDAIGQSIIGVLSLLFDTRLRGSIMTQVGDGGLQCLVMSKAHFFTAINECPALVAGFLELYDYAGEEAAPESVSKAVSTDEHADSAS